MEGTTHDPIPDPAAGPAQASRPLARMRLVALAPLGLLTIGVVVVLTRLALVTSPPAPTGASPVNAGGDAPGITVEAVLTQAKNAMRNAKPQAAELLLRDASVRWPNDQSLRLAWGEALMGCNRFADAFEQYSRACVLGPDRAEYRFLAAMSAFQAGMAPEAQDQCQVAAKLNPSNPQYPLYLAQIERKLGNNNGARAHLVIAAKLDPSLAIAWGSLAAIALDENNPGMGLDYVAKARKLEPDSNIWRVLQSKLLRRDGRPADGLALLAAVPEFERFEDITVVDEIANCQGMLGKPGEAAQAYIQSLQQHADNPELAYQAALWLDRSGERGGALEYARRAAAGGSKNGQTLLDQIEGRSEAKTGAASDASVPRSTP